MPSKKVIIVQLPWIEEFSHKLSDEKSEIVSIQNFWFKMQKLNTAEASQRQRGKNFWQNVLWSDVAITEVFGQIE